jgi:hypothetical protein
MAVDSEIFSISLSDKFNDKSFKNAKPKVKSWTACRSSIPNIDVSQIFEIFYALLNCRKLFESQKKLKMSKPTKFYGCANFLHHCKFVKLNNIYLCIID